VRVYTNVFHNLASLSYDFLFLLTKEMINHQLVLLGRELGLLQDQGGTQNYHWRLVSARYWHPGKQQLNRVQLLGGAIKSCLTE
jgi:hypothetical protein